MTARLQKAAWIALLIACVLGFGFLLLYSSKYEPKAAAPQSASQHTNEEVDRRTPEQRVADYTLWLERFTGLLALVSAVQIGFLIRADINSAKSAQAAARTVASMEATAERQLRAYIAIESAFLDGIPKAGETITVSISVKNYGKTPAYKCVASVNCAILDFDGDKAADIFPDDLDAEFVGVIHPGAVLTKSRIRPSISGDEARGLLTRKKALWLFGKFTYAVVFDMPLRETKFRYLLTADIPGRIRCNFGRSQYGNDAT